jgi:hypothetical protein
MLAESTRGPRTRSSTSRAVAVTIGKSRTPPILATKSREDVQIVMHVFKAGVVIRGPNPTIRAPIMELKPEVPLMRHPKWSSLLNRNAKAPKTTAQASSQLRAPREDFNFKSSRMMSN